MLVDSKRQIVGVVVGVVIGFVALIGFIAVPIVYLRRQWARAEENKLRLTARMSGLDESEVRSEVGSRVRRLFVGGGTLHSSSLLHATCDCCCALFLQLIEYSFRSVLDSSGFTALPELNCSLTRSHLTFS